jgi:hypothetical protein
MLQRLNGAWHERGLQVFMIIVLGHWTEHILQAWQIYYLGMPVAHAHGALGHFFPWLVTSEVLHYGYALVMLTGLWILRGGFTDVEDRRWWTIALGIQFFHHIEHFLLIIQATLHHPFFGRQAPTSLIQLWIPRVELHLFYNTIVFVPMVVAMYLHVFAKRAPRQCTCAWNRDVAAV